MSGVKRLIEENEHKLNVAVHIALQAGGLIKCNDHDEVYSNDTDGRACYSLGNVLIRPGQEYDGVFQSPVEMGEFMKQALDGAGIECVSCAKMNDE